MARNVESKMATQKWVASAGGGRLYIAGSDSDELWSCALDAPGAATLVGTFPRGLAARRRRDGNGTTEGFTQNLEAAPAITDR